MMAASVGGTALAGFGMYKSVQMETGGTVRIAFGSSDSKNAAPPAPLPSSLRRLAIWPGDAAEVRLAERLSASGRFNVVTPDAVSRALAHGGLELASMTSGERSAALDRACRATGAQAVALGVQQGTSTNDNLFSLHRGNVTTKVDLEVYDCRAHQVAWRDTMAIILDVGGHTPDETEVNRIAGDAWADRLLQAAGTSIRAAWQ